MERLPVVALPVPGFPVEAFPVEAFPVADFPAAGLPLPDFSGADLPPTGFPGLGLPVVGLRFRRSWGRSRRSMKGTSSRCLCTAFAISSTVVSQPGRISTDQRSVGTQATSATLMASSSAPFSGGVRRSWPSPGRVRS
jgi:hypothetical protein